MDELLLSLLIGVIKGVTYVYDALTYIPCYLLLNPDKRLQISNRIKARSVDGSTSSPYRTVDHFSSLTTTPFPGCDTLDDLFSRAADVHAHRDCLGTRQLLSEDDELQPNGKLFKKAIYGQYEWQSYAEVSSRVDTFGRGLLGLGQKPRDSILLFSETRAEWMLVVQSCFRYNFPVVTLYSTLGEDAIVHGVNESEVSVIITSGDLVAKFKSILPQMPHVKHLIYLDSGKRVNLDGFPKNVDVHSMASVEERGMVNKSVSIAKPTREDLAVIMYTSGSTGLPKGVMISHGNLMSGMSGQCQRIPNLGPKDTYIGYLPLAHVLELSAEISCMAYGTRIGFSSPSTITDQSSRIKKGSKGDTAVLKPTLMASVPLIMDRIYKAVWEKVNEGGPFKKKLFTFAFNYKCWKIQQGMDTPIFNKFVFRPIRKLLGGRVRLILSGSAPLSVDTQRFMNVCFCCPVGQGYGLTETCGAGTIQDASDLSVGRVGAPLQCNEVMLRNWEEGGYTTEDYPYPRGEILMGGGNIALGYYKNPQKTREDFIQIKDTRYFCTGDIGQLQADGCLRIIDRKKDLVKLQAGEYVSLGKVETVLKMCPLVDNICVYADSSKMYTVCLAVPNPKHVKVLAAKMNLQVEGEGEDWHALCNNPVVEKAVLKQLQECGQKGRLEKFEVPQRITLCREVWTPDLGLVTDAFKLKRKNIQTRYQNDINRMYA